MALLRLGRLFGSLVVKRTFRARHPIAEGSGFTVPLPLFLTPPTFVLMMTATLSATVLLTLTIPYDSSNYQWVLAAELQALAAIFGLIVVGTLTVGTSMRRPMFMPARMILVILATFTVVMILDVLGLLSLAPSVSMRRLFIINLTVCLNIIPLLSVMSYLVVVLDWLRPATYMAGILNRFGSDNNPETRMTAIYALEEIGVQAYDRRDIEVGHRLNEAFVALATILFRQEPRDSTAVDQMITTAAVMKRLTELYAQQNLTILVEGLAHASRSIKSFLDSWQLLQEEPNREKAEALVSRFDALIAPPTTC